VRTSSPSNFIPARPFLPEIFEAKFEAAFEAKFESKPEDSKIDYASFVEFINAKNYNSLCGAEPEYISHFID
jgi:hypothetical protein